MSSFVCVPGRSGGVSSLETRCTGCLRSFLRHGDGIAPTNRDRNVQEASCLLLDLSSFITANYYNHRGCLQPQHLGCAPLGSPLQQGRDDAGCSGRGEWDGTGAWDDGAWVSCFLPRHALWAAVRLAAGCCSTQPPLDLHCLCCQPEPIS